MMRFERWIGVFVVGSAVSCMTGCSDPDSRLGKTFDRGLSIYKEARQKGVDLTRPTRAAGVSSLGIKYKNFFAMPAALGPLMKGRAGRATLERARAAHPDADGRALAAICLRIRDAKRKQSYHFTGPIKGRFMHWHYD